MNEKRDAAAQKLLRAIDLPEVGKGTVEENWAERVLATEDAIDAIVAACQEPAGCRCGPVDGMRAPGGGQRDPRYCPEHGYELGRRHERAAYAEEKKRGEKALSDYADMCDPVAGEMTKLLSTLAGTPLEVARHGLEPGLCMIREHVHRLIGERNSLKHDLETRTRQLKLADDANARLAVECEKLKAEVARRVEWQIGAFGRDTIASAASEEVRRLTAEWEERGGIEQAHTLLAVRGLPPAPDLGQWRDITCAEIYELRDRKPKDPA